MKILVKRKYVELVVGFLISMISAILLSVLLPWLNIVTKTNPTQIFIGTFGFMFFSSLSHSFRGRNQKILEVISMLIGWFILSFSVFKP